MRNQAVPPAACDLIVQGRLMLEGIPPRWTDGLSRAPKRPVVADHSPCLGSLEATSATPKRQEIEHEQ